MDNRSIFFEFWISIFLESLLAMIGIHFVGQLSLLTITIRINFIGKTCPFESLQGIYMINERKGETSHCQTHHNEVDGLPDLLQLHVFDFILQSLSPLLPDHLLCRFTRTFWVNTCPW
jgi:hypothetical protein